MKIFEKQIYHLVSLTLLLLGIGLMSRMEGFQLGQFLRLETTTWFVCALVIPILHQVYVLIVWRLELHYQWITRSLGEKGFGLYAVGFMLLFLSRFLILVGLAISNQNTLLANPWIPRSFALILLPPLIYVLHSTLRYFGLKRALGVDHFDPSYRGESLAQRGIFKYLRNPMYSLGLLSLWIPGLIWVSKAALLAALFGHLYIWVHYFFTEVPDMKRIYGEI